MRALRPAAAILLFAVVAGAQDEPGESVLPPDEAEAPAEPSGSSAPPGLEKLTPEMIEREQALAEPYEAADPLPAPGPARAAWLARDPILSKLEFRSDTHHEGIEVLVQPPAGGDD